MNKEKSNTWGNIVSFIIVFSILMLKWWIYQKQLEEKKQAEERKKSNREKSENEKPEFLLRRTEKFKKLVLFNFGGKEVEFQSRVEAKEEFYFKKFKLVVQDVFQKGQFKEISFELFKDDQLVEKITPEIDYKYW